MSVFNSISAKMLHKCVVLRSSVLNSRSFCWTRSIQAFPSFVPQPSFHPALRSIENFQIPFCTNFSTSSKCLEKSVTDMHHQIYNYLKGSNEVSSIDKTLEPVDNPEEVINRLIITIAHNEFVEGSDLVVKIFRLYASSKRAVIQDKVNMPAEFDKMMWKADQLVKFMSFEEIRELSASLMQLRSQKVKVIDRLLSTVCSECSCRVASVGLNEGINYFEILLNVFSSGLGKKANYDIFIDFFAKHIHEASQNDLVKLMYYSSMYRNAAASTLVEKALLELQSAFGEMPFETLGIIANSVLNSGIKSVPDEALFRHLHESLLNKLEKMDDLNSLDEFNLQAILKLFRLLGYKPPSFTIALKNRLMESQNTSFDVSVIVSILAYFAQSSYHRDLFELMEKKLVDAFSDNQVSVTLTDYARIMWSFSRCNHACSQQLLDLVHQDMRHLFIDGSAHRNYAKYADILFSLAILGHSDDLLLKKVFLPGRGMSKASAQKKLVQRLQNLVEHISIELPHLAASLPKKPYFVSPSTVDHRSRPAFDKLFDSLEGFGNFSVGTPLKFVNITGICCTDTELGGLLAKCVPVSIEVVDASCSVPEGRTKRPTGLFNYKVRLLKKLGWHVVVLNEEDVENCDDLKTLVINAIKSTVDAKTDDNVEQSG